MALHRLIAMEMGVPDPATLDAFYQGLGFRGAPGRWGGVDSEDQITLCEAPYRQLKSLRIACHDEADLAGAAARLEAIGVSSTLSQGVLKVVDPLNGWEVWLEPQEELVVAPAEPRAMNYPGRRGRINTRASVITEQEARRPRRLGHVVVGSPEPGKTTELFRALGFRVSDQVAGGIATFMRCSPDHHNLLVAPGPVPYLNHYAIEQEDFDSVFKAATTYLGQYGGEHQVAGPGRHQIGGNVFWYMLDPAGNIFEFFTDMDQILDDDAWTVEDWRTPDAWSVWGNKQQPEVFFAPADMQAIVEGWHQAHS